MQRKTILALLIHAAVVFLILLIAILPLLSVVVAGGIANANGCQLDEGSVHPCVVKGTDLGETLYSMGVLGWLMLVTLPVGLGAAFLYVMVVVVVYLVRRSRISSARGRAGTGAES